MPLSLLGLSPRATKIIAIALAVMAVLGLIYWALDSYGDREYAKGRGDEKAIWEQAERDFIQKGAEARTDADRDAAEREAVHANAVAQEREKIDEAVADGRSPLDVLFPSSMR